MNRAVALRRIAPTLGVFLVLACGGSYQSASVPEPARAPRETTDVLTGTCKEYDLDARTMDVIAGLSFVLREVTFQIHGDTDITIEGERAGLIDMRAGMVVRVEYRVTRQGNLADKIEVVLDARGLR